MRTERRLPDFLKVKCLLDSDPLPRAWVAVNLETSYKNPFHLFFGPADSRGVLEIARSQLLEEAQKERDLAMMDYGHPEVHWTGQIEIKVYNTSDIERALHAYEVWGGSSFYPPSFKEKLTEMDALLRKHPNEVLRAEVTVVPEGAATVEVIEQKAGE